MDREDELTSEEWDAATVADWSEETYSIPQELLDYWQDRKRKWESSYGSD
jgi:hypothetical protein